MPDDVCLSLALRKSAGKTDEFGNYIFEVEASNENLDLQNQIVLQNALMESREEFLRNGVISYDHLHKRKAEDGSAISDPSMVIGEPMDVRAEGKSTIVTGKLYSTNEKAREIIKMLKAGSTRVKASVGGIFPKIVKDARTGVEKVIHVLWNDLALTVSPVNGTVGSAGLAKALEPGEFVAALPEEMKKALSAGYETDSEGMEGGRTLAGEDVQGAAADVSPEGSADMERKAIDELIRRLRSQKIRGIRQAEAFLVSFGMEEARAAEAVREILKQGEEMKKGSFQKHISGLLKSLTGGGAQAGGMEDEDLDAEEKSCAGEDEELEKSDEELEELEDGDFEDEPAEDDEEEEDEEEPVEAEELMKSLSAEIRSLRKSQKALRAELRRVKEVQDNLARVAVDMAQEVHRIGSEPVPPRSVLNKSLAKGERKTPAPSQSDIDTVNEILVKAVKDGKIDLFKSSLILSDFQKSMFAGKPMRKEFYDFLQAEYAAGRN